MLECAYLGNATAQQVAYLPDDGTELVTGTFLVTSITDPTFSFSAGGVPYWTGLAFTLREVKPHA